MRLCWNTVDAAGIWRIFRINSYFITRCCSWNIYHKGWDCPLALSRSRVYQPERATTLQRRHNGRDSVSNHQPHHCLLSGLFRHRSKKTSKLRVTGLCAGNSPMAGEFPAQMASNAENVSIWWRHHGCYEIYICNPWRPFYHRQLSYISPLNPLRVVTLHEESTVFLQSRLCIANVKCTFKVWVLDRSAGNIEAADITSRMTINCQLTQNLS